jgi:signal transduction histidine kinase
MRPGLLIFLCSFFILRQGLAQEVFPIDSFPDAYHKISNYISYLEDPSGTYTLKQIRNEYSDEFKPFRGNRKFNHESVYWGKITFKSNLEVSSDWVFYAGSNNHMDVFIPERSGYRRQKAGFFDPASEKSGTGLESSGIRINLRPGEIKTLYIRAHNVNHYPVKFNVHLISPETWSEYISKEDRNLVQGFFQGILWIMILYNIFLFFINRDKTYLYYTAYMIGLSIYFLNIHGFFTDSAVSLFKNSPKMTWYISIAVNISAIFYVQFIRTFLNLEQLLPKWDQISQYFVWGFIGLVVFKIGVLITSFNIPVINLVMQTLLLVGSLFSLILVIYLFRTGDKVARFFIAGTFFLVVSMLVSALSYINMGGFSFNYFNYLQGGVVIEIILFSLGLGYRMRVSEEEKLTAQTELINQLTENERIQKRATSELEQKVQERTAQIMEKNKELEHRNEEILNQSRLLEDQKQKIESQRDRLKAINDDLQQLNEEKNHLMSIVAHDLRNPLGSAMSVTDLMSEDKDDLTEDQNEYLGLLKRTCATMLIR